MSKCPICGIQSLHLTDHECQEPPDGGLDETACSAWVEVTKDDFDQYISNYPKPLEKNIARMCEPPMLTYNDFTFGNWPKSIVAKAKMYDGSDYHNGKSPVYYLPNAKHLAAGPECSENKQ